MATKKSDYSVLTSKQKKKRIVPGTANVYKTSRRDQTEEPEQTKANKSYYWGKSKIESLPQRKKRIVPGTGKVERRKGDDGTPWVKSFTPVGLDNGKGRWGTSDYSQLNAFVEVDQRRKRSRKGKF